MTVRGIWERARSLMRMVVYSAAGGGGAGRGSDGDGSVHPSPPFGGKKGVELDRRRRVTQEGRDEDSESVALSAPPDSPGLAC